MENSASPSGQSSYPTPTGRPSLWSGSDQRKLARLYVYTTLPIQKILSVLQMSSDTDGHPGKDSANKKLNAMLDKEPRWLHPRTRTDMDRRMQELERSPVRTQAPDAFSGGRPYGNSVSSSHMSRSSATRDIKEETGTSPTVMTTVEAPEPIATLGSMLDTNMTTTNNYTNAMEWAPSPAPAASNHPYQQPLHLDTDMMDFDASAVNDEPLGLAPLEPPRPNRFSAHLRRRSTAMTGATDTTTNTLRQALSEYSDGFIRNVKKVIKRYTMPPQFELAAASAISPVSELRPQTADSTRGSWLYDENAPAAKHSAGYLPGDFLCLDRLLVAQGFCAPGMPEHDTRACLCHLRDEANPSFWVTQHGPAEWIAGLLAGGIRDRTQLELRDPFGNSVLHLFAARDGPGMPLLLALQMASAAEMNVCNNAGQTFLHVLHPMWFVDMGPGGPLMQLLGNLRQVAQFDVYRRDVYGRNFFHILQMKVPDQATLNFVLRQYDASKYCRRDAFGMAPHCSDEAVPAQGIRRAYTAVDESGTGAAPGGFTDNSYNNNNLDLDASHHTVLLADAADRSQDIRLPSATDAITRQTQLLQLMQKAYDRPDVEDAHGRNALHCLSAAVLNPHTLAARFGSEPRPVHLSATGPSTSSAAATTSGMNARRRADQTAKQRKLERLDSTRAQLERRGNLAEGFLASGVDANHYDGDGNTVLMAFAAQLPEDDDYKVPVEILQMLLDSGRADLHARNRHGETALHVAVRRGRKLATRTLVQAGANVHARDADGRSVLDVADLKLTRARDEKMYAHFEACRAWLSGQGRAVQYPTVLQEWGLGPAGRTAM